MYKKSIVAILAAFFLSSTAAFSAPIQYTFTTGTIVIGTDAGVGLIPNGTAASGSFTYNPDAPVVYTDPNGTFHGGSILDFHVNIGSFSAFDAVAYNYIADSKADFFLPGGIPFATDRDFLQFYMDEIGGAWSSSPLGSSTVARIRMNWLQGPSDADFLSSESLLPELPTFAGNFLLDVGPLLNGSLGPASGYISFNNLRVTKVSVPEPQIASLFFAGVLALVFVGRRRTLA